MGAADKMFCAQPGCLPSFGNTEKVCLLMSMHDIIRDWKTGSDTR